MKIVHLIDSLVLGGTENQLLALLPDLARDHEIVLVTLHDQDRPGLGELPVAKRYSLGFKGPSSLPRAILKLRKIISREQPDLVRSQLYWSGVAARLATPRSIPLIFSIHSTMSIDAYSKRRSALWLEKLTYRRRHHLLSVSAEALADFDRHVGLKGGSDVLTNFINPLFLEARRKKASAGPPLRLVAAGNLKSVKNYDYLLEVLGELPGEIQLDIYGEGSLRAALERRIAASGLNARLLGARSDLWNVLANYDLFVMPSLYEGCPNAAIEAMAVGLPLLLSDIPVMREISQGNALFFDPNDPRSFVEMFERIRSGEVDLAAMSRKGLDLVQARYLKSGYVERLNSIYARKAKAAQVSPNEA